MLISEFPNFAGNSYRRVAARGKEILTVHSNHAECYIPRSLKEDGFTSLMCASQEGHERVVDTLLKGGARVNMHVEDGFTSLMCASQEGHERVVDTLLKGGARVNMHVEDGWTALMSASSNNHPEVVEKLLAAGAQPNHQKSSGRTALMFSCMLGHKKVVETLLNGGATIDMQAKDGTTALSLARKNGHHRVVELLQKASTQPQKKEQQKVGGADGTCAAAATEHLNGEGSVLKVEPDGRPSAHKPLSAAVSDAQLIQQHIKEQGSLNMTSYKMLLSGLPCTGKTTAMLRLSNQLQHLDPNDPPVPSTGFEKPQTVEVYHRTVKQSVMISGAGAEAEWKYQDLEEQGQTLYSHILKSSSNTFSPAMTSFSSQSDIVHKEKPVTLLVETYLESAAEEQSSLNSVDENVLPSQPSTTFNEQQALLHEKFLTSLVKAQGWDVVREKLKAIEDVTMLHIMDCGGHPECHEILPLLLEGQALTLIFLNLTHDLDKTYRVVFRGKEGPSCIEYESVFTAREVLQCILCSISSLQSGAHKEKPVALLVGSYLDQSNEEAVLTLEKCVQEALKSFIEKDILFPANDKEEKYIATLNNMSEDQGDIEELRRVILTITETRFQPEPIPTAWLLLHLLLRAKYEKEPGWCTVKECVEIATACGIIEEELLGEDGILRYIHKSYGTMLYYPKVAGLSGKVICDPNIILHPFTQTFLYSFACNRGHIQTAKSIRTTGEIPHDLMESISATTSANPIPASEIVALLKDCYILYESVRTAAGTWSYFMPCLLQPDPSVVNEASNPATLSSLSPAPLQFVPRSTGYVPLGLFPALVVKMSHTWCLKPGERFRNRIQFRVRQEGKPTRGVEFRQHPSYLELRLLHTSSKQASRAMDLSILTSCRHQLWEALHQVSSKYPHMKDVVWQFGFYCPGGLQRGGQPPSAVCQTKEMMEVAPVDMECLHEPCCEEEDFCLEDKHKSWFEKVLPTANTKTTATADGVPLEYIPAVPSPPPPSTTVATGSGTLPRIEKQQSPIKDAVSPSAGVTSIAIVLDSKPRLAELVTLRTRKGEHVNIIESLAPQWKQFGVYLDFDDTGRQLDLIEAKHAHESHCVVACCQEMFKHWLEGNGVQSVTWRTLIELLDHCNKLFLVEQIEDALKLN